MKQSLVRMMLVLLLTGSATAACDDGDRLAWVPPRVVDVSVTPTEANLVPGTQVTLVGTVANDTTGERSGVRWSSDNKSIATVDSASGVVTAVAAGSAKITATSRYGPPFDTASAAVYVLPLVVDSCQIMVVPSTATISVSERLQLQVPCSIQVTWSSSDERVVTVDASGFVTGVSAGKAVVTATFQSDPTRTATSVVTVTAAGQ